MKIAIEIGGRREEEAAYGNLGNCYQSLSDYRKSIEYHEKHLKTLKANVDRGGEGGANRYLGLLTGDSVTLENPLSIMRNI